MSMTDPLGDLLTRIRNGQQARKDSVVSPASKLRARVLDVLQREGYIRGYSEEDLGSHPGLRIELKYFEGRPAIQHVARVSKPGRRVYSGSKDLPRVRNGLGITIVSTPRGVLSDAEAREQNVGGEVLAETPAGTGTGTFPMRLISEHLREHFAADILVARFRVGQNTLWRRYDGDAHAVTHDREIFRTRIDAAAGLGHASHMLDRGLALKIFQLDAQAIMAGDGLGGITADIAFALKDIQHAGTQLGRG